MKLKNLFDYATKELSQDAFLAWLIDNIDAEDNEVREASRGLLNWFGINTDGKVSVQVEMQYPAKTETDNNQRKMDVVVFVTTEKGKQVLCIEDKTTSTTGRNQLVMYDAKLRELAEDGFSPVKIYYKTSRMKQPERDKVNEAKDWRIIEMDEIRAFWGKYVKASNLILQNYAEHVSEIADVYFNAVRPETNDVGRWESYFNNTIFPLLEEKGFSCEAGRTEQFGGKEGAYAYLAVRPKGFGEGYPYLEVRSSQCDGNRFVALILTYGQDEEKYPELVQRLEQHLKEQKYDLFKKCNYKREKAKTKSSKVNSEEEFIAMTLSAAEEYRTILAAVTK